MTTANSRSKSEAILDVRYEIRLHFLHARLYRRLQSAAAILALLAGSASITPLLQGLPHGVLVAGVLVAVFAACDLVFRWSDKAAHHHELRRRLTELLERTPDLDVAGIDRELARIDVDDSDEIESLRIPAYNDNLRSNGYEDWVRPMSFMARLIRMIA